MIFPVEPSLTVMPLLESVGVDRQDKCVGHRAPVGHRHGDSRLPGFICRQIDHQRARRAAARHI